MVGGVFIENRLAVIGLALLAMMVLFSFVGPLVYHTNQSSTNLLLSNRPPGNGHPLGTDYEGYDVLGRLMIGGQMSLEIGLAAGVLATTIGMIWGALAGYFGGIVDTILMRIVDSLMAIPQLFLVLVLAVLVTPTPALLILIIASISWLTPARLVRAETLTLKTREFVEAVKLMGGSSPRAITRHVIPNAVGTIVVNASFQVADAILMLAYLSFLGLGVPPPATNWGDMLSNGVQFIFDGYWWQIYPAGICIVVTVVAFNFVGDALRDAFEVRLQRR